jgi:hypothetical protein
VEVERAEVEATDIGPNLKTGKRLQHDRQRSMYAPFRDRDYVTIEGRTSSCLVGSRALFTSRLLMISSHAPGAALR